MTRRLLCGFSFSVFAALVACTGGSSMLPTHSMANLRAASPGEKFKTYVELPPVVPGSPLPMPQPPLPDETPGPELSSATRSVRVFNGTARIGTFQLDASQTGCFQEQDGLQCSFSLTLPSTANRQLRLVTYASKAGTGSPLAIGTGNADGDITAIAWTGVARRIIVSTMPSTLHAGTPAWSTIFAYGIDSAGAVIPQGKIANEKGVRITSIGLRGSGPYAYSATLPSSFTMTAFAYDGKKTGTETITATPAKGLPAANTRLTLSDAPPPAPSIFANVALGYGNGIAQFDQSATGDSAPSSLLALAAQPEGIFGADAWNDIWVSYASPNVATIVKRYDASLHQLTQLVLPCGVAIAADAEQRIYSLEYFNENSECDNVRRSSRDAYEPLSVYVLGPKGWQAQWGLDVTASSGALAVDAKGDVYVSRVLSYNDYGISEYAAGAAGSAPPIATFDTGDGNAIQLAVDESRNVYALFPNGGVWEYPAGSTTAVPRVTGVRVLSFGVAPNGTVYASVITDGNAFAIEGFASNAQTPTSVIAGPATQLFVPTQYYPQQGQAPIAVAP